MTHHSLKPAAGVIHDYFSRDLPPALYVDSGDTVTVESLDARGYLSRPEIPGSYENTFMQQPRGHALSGPIYVNGATPGAALAVHLVSLTPGAWGWTVAGGPKNTFMDYLGMPREVMARLSWDLDPQAGTGKNNLGMGVELRPFLGVTGLAPTEPGEHTTTPPRYCGGNIDCKDLVAGTVLYIPVGVEGGLLSVGDGHARQGDGEVSGTAIECPMTTELELTVVPDPVLDTIHAKTPTARITFGFDVDLNKASAAALDAMLIWMTKLYGISKAEALAVASSTVDLRVTQVANLTWGVHAVHADDAVTK